jgi:hypothetical protein
MKSLLLTLTITLASLSIMSCSSNPVSVTSSNTEPKPIKVDYKDLDSAYGELNFSYHSARIIIHDNEHDTADLSSRDTVVWINYKTSRLIHPKIGDSIFVYFIKTIYIIDKFPTHGEVFAVGYEVAHEVTEESSVIEITYNNPDCRKFVNIYYDSDEFPDGYEFLYGEGRWRQTN